MADVELVVGCRALSVTDPVQGVRVPVHVLHPAAGAVAPARFGPYTPDVPLGAPVAGTRRRVVAISHGNGGTPWGYRGLAAELARAGFVVALIEHPGNSRNGNDLAGTPANLANRPRHVRLTLDALFADADLAAHVVAGQAAVIGHSIGGYTALATAGGRPMALPQETPDGVAHPVSVERDPRVAAVVLFAPALPWFMGPGALAEVHVPMLVRSGERDTLMPPGVIEQILRGLPADARVDYQVVPGAGHFAWMTPFPPALAGPAFPPSQDPPGFDRVAYLARLGPEVVSFLRTTLDA